MVAQVRDRVNHYRDRLQTAQEYASVRPLKGEPVGIRVSVLIGQEFVEHGWIENWHGPETDRKAYVRFDSGLHGSWSAWSLRMERTPQYERGEPV